jgi:hypothetical protein
VPPSPRGWRPIRGASRKRRALGRSRYGDWREGARPVSYRLACSRNESASSGYWSPRPAALFPVGGRQPLARTGPGLHPTRCRSSSRLALWRRCPGAAPMAPTSQLGRSPGRARPDRGSPGHVVAVRHTRVGERRSAPKRVIPKSPGDLQGFPGQLLPFFGGSMVTVIPAKKRTSGG